MEWLCGSTINCSATRETRSTITSDEKQVKVNEPVKVTAEVKFGNKDISKDTILEFEIIENGVSVGSVNPENEANRSTQ